MQHVWTTRAPSRLSNLVKWTTASKTDIHYVISDLDFDENLKQPKTSAVHDMMCRVRILGEAVENHYAQCTGLVVGNPTLEVDGHYR